MVDIIGMSCIFVIVVVFMSGLAFAMWTMTEGYGERVRRKRQLNNIAISKAKKQARMELTLQEWQHTASLEDLARHRERMAKKLDALHDE